MFKKLVTIAALAFATAASLSAQDKPFYDLIAQDHNRAGISAHSYEPSDTAVTSAPDGYTAFYVSHIGRHGSRFQTNNDKSKNPYAFVAEFQEYAQAGCLSELGMQVLKEMQTIADMSEGNFGQLTELGALEHRQIAGRLVSHYPEIFSNPARNHVNAYDTHVPRVVESRKNFLSVVSAAYPSLEMKIGSLNKKSEDHKINAERVRGITPPKELSEKASEAKKDDAYKAAYDEANAGLKRPSSKSIVKNLFTTEPEGLGASKLVRNIYGALKMARCLGVDASASESLFDDAYCYATWASGNVSWYYNCCNCTENPTKATLNYVGRTILKHFIEDADEAVKPGSNVAADFRFSHDTKVLPFIAAVAPETCCYAGSLSKANENVFLPQVVCMGCNMQWIFYHNDKDQVLVKVLQNEKEVKIPGVKAFRGVYYKWSDLRKDLLKKSVIK